MSCFGCTNILAAEQVSRYRALEHDLVGAARRLLKTAGDPFSACISFLHECEESTALPGYLINNVLVEAFGDRDKIPGLVRILATHVREIARRKNVIELVNEHPAAERWGNFIIKQRERINFEVAFERGRLVLNNISGLIGVEHGVELPLERIKVQPPKLLVTVKLGVLRPQKEVDI